MPALTPANLFFYAVQVSILIAALAAALALLRPSPGFRLIAYRVLFAMLLVLPFQPMFRPEAAPMPAIDVPAFTDSVEARVEPDVARPLWWRPVVLGVLAAGVVVRGIWLLVGLLRLRRYVPPLPDGPEPADIAALQADFGTSARVAFVDGVAQPVTFGIAPAIVLLPAALASASSDERRAVVSHELLHVRRRDWLWVLVEECVLTLLWFVPAVWWLVGELQLAREQIVDRLTVAATGARRAYMDALFSAADAPSAPPLLAGFLRRRHLARRLVALAEEVVMSRARLAVGGMVVLGVLAGSGAVAVAAWPLAAAPRAQEPVMAFQPKPDVAGSLKVLHRSEIDMPGGLTGQITHATIGLDLVVDGQGEVTSVRPVSLLIRNASNGAQLSASDMGALRGLIEGVAAQLPAGRTPPFTDAAAIARDVDALRQAASAALSGWRFASPAAAPAIARVAVGFDLQVSKATAGPAQPISGFAGVADTPVSTFTVRDGAPVPDGTLRVGGAIKPPQKIVNVNPIYPQEARDAKIQGVVIIECRLDTDGRVAEAWVLRSIPLLDQAALDAVRQWRYSPTLMNGAPVPVQMTVTIGFTLDQ